MEAIIIFPAKKQTMPTAFSVLLFPAVGGLACLLAWSSSSGEVGRKREEEEISRQLLERERESERLDMVIGSGSGSYSK